MSLEVYSRGSVLSNAMDGGVEVARSSLDLNLDRERKQWATVQAFKNNFYRLE